MKTVLAVAILVLSGAAASAETILRVIDGDTHVISAPRPSSSTTVAAPTK